MPHPCRDSPRSSPVAARSGSSSPSGSWLARALALSAPSSPTSRATRRRASCPTSAESTQVQELLKDRFPGGETSIGLIVYRRDGGLTAADKAGIASDARQVDDAIPVTRPAHGPVRAPTRRRASSRADGDAAYTVVTVPLDFDKVADWGKDARDDRRRRRPTGCDVYVTGDLGLFADFEEVFGELDTKLLLATVLLVLSCSARSTARR